MARNKWLHEANRAKKDEFYTQLEDITNELKHYKDHFKDKVVLCNCDDPYESNFFKYFALMFNDLGLKKLICTCWNGSPITGKELNLFDEEPTEDGRSRIAYKLELTEVKDLTGNGVADLEDIQLFLQQHKLERLKGNGDFQSEECVELLKEADIVVTNPPFSLFREYVAQLVKYDKKFLIIGNMNAITYKEIFPLIKENKMWIGYRFNKRVGGKNMTFKVPDDYPLSGTEVYINEQGERFISVAGTGWFTNLDHKKRHYPLDLYKHYTPEEYPKYENYDAIEVGQTADIPMDYDGIMGVPISFLDKYCPEQFELLAMTENNEKNKPYHIPNQAKYDRPYLKGKRMYSRLLIRKKQ